MFYSAWVWWLLLAVRGIFTLDLAYRAFRSTSPKHFLVVRQRQGPLSTHKPRTLTAIFVPSKPASQNGYNKLSIVTLLIAIAAGACMLHAIFGTGEPGVLPPGGTPESRSLSQKAAGVLGLVAVTLDVCGCVVM